VLSRSSVPHTTFESMLFVPRSALSVFSAAHCFWVWAFCPLKCSLGLQRCTLLLSAGCLSLEVLSRSSAPHTAFGCRLFVPRSILLVFSTAYCSRVWVVCPSKCSLSLLCRILLSSAGCLPLEIFPTVHHHLLLSSTSLFVP
jgi:hypothetical protein